MSQETRSWMFAISVIVVGLIAFNFTPPGTEPREVGIALILTGSACVILKMLRRS